MAAALVLFHNYTEVQSYFLIAIHFAMFLITLHFRPYSNPLNNIIKILSDALLVVCFVLLYCIHVYYQKHFVSDVRNIDTDKLLVFNNLGQSVMAILFTVHCLHFVASLISIGSFIAKVRKKIARRVQMETERSSKINLRFY